MSSLLAPQTKASARPVMEQPLRDRRPYPVPALLADSAGPPGGRPARSWWQERLPVLYYLGSLLVAVGALLLLPLFYWALDGESGMVPWTTFLLPAVLSVGAGLLLRRVLPQQVPSVRDAMVITGVGWLLVGLVGAVPFMLGLHKSFIDAFFESVSGLTTTGITVFEGLDEMPRSLLLWRSLSQWLGGLGILTFFLAVGFRSGGAAATLFGAEGHKINASRPVPGIFNTVRALWTIYIIFTAGSFVLFAVGGMSDFDALNHCLTCISTGGFSTHDQSLAFYANQGYAHAGFLEYVAIVFMLAGGINFLVHYKVLSGETPALWRSFEMRWFWGLTAGAVALILLDHQLHFSRIAVGEAEGLARSFRAVLFQVASLISSTGYATVDINDRFFPALSKLVFVILMIIGGCVGSTAGGFKVLRLGILVQMLRTQIHRLAAPRRAVLPVVVSGQPVQASELQRIGALLGGWLVLIAVGAGVTAIFSNLDPWQSLSGMTSAVGNMGPFYFSVHEMASTSWVIKGTYIFGMLAGRLEILPLIILLSRRTWR